MVFQGLTSPLWCDIFNQVIDLAFEGTEDSKSVNAQLRAPAGTKEPIPTRIPSIRRDRSFPIYPRHHGIQNIKASEMNFYNCGFYLSYLHDLHPKITELDLESVLKGLCTFSCEAVISSRNSQKPTPMDSKLIAVYENLLSRGLPTFPSLLVEGTLARLPHSHIPIHEESETGSFEFRHRDLDAETEEDWLNLLKKAHYIIDPRLTANDLLSESFDSDEEKKFFSSLLPQFLGNHITQLVETQRLFETLIDREMATQFIRQRVDFALETDQIKVVFEVDGEQHEEPGQRRIDERRDKILKNSGWEVFRIPARDVRCGRLEQRIEQDVNLLRDKLATNPFFALTEQNYQSPLWETELGQKALQLVLTPFSVARLQKTLLLALRASVLSLHQSKWRLVIVERDVPCAQLAILDFLQTLQAFYNLLEINTPLPEIELLIYTTPEFERASSGVSEDQLSEFRINTNQQVLDSQNAETFHGDLLIDISVLQRYGFTKSDLGSNSAAVSIRSVHTPGDRDRIQSSEPIAYPMTDDKREPLRFFLQNLFRKQDFREGQFEILTRSLAQKPVIGLLPTGAGKSLCYQLSALLQPGVTFVIDPLRSLMFDQAENLKTNRIDRIAFINSEQETKEREKIIRQMGNGEFQIIFIAPERLQIKKIREELRRMTTAFSVPYVVVDEAHCVSEWGHDFRTSYLNLASTVQDFCRFRNIPPTIVALTGTASYAVLTDIQREIGIGDEEAKIYPSTFDREELRFSLYTVPSNQKQSQLLDILNVVPNQFSVNVDSFYEPNGDHTHSGIVFVPHVNGAFGENVRTVLSHELDIPVEFYSGTAPKNFEPEPKLNLTEREQYWNKYKQSVQQRFKKNEFTLLVSTKAFGMGIDKPNIRYTIHYGIPQSLEAFYQEAGRAGRDRQNSICAIIFSDDSAANADVALDSHRSIDEIAKLPDPPLGKQGDIHRMMWFQKQGFQGARAEKRVIFELLEDSIYPCLHHQTLQLNQSEEIQIPFGRSDSIKMKREKAIYRLSIIGVVQDYTIDFRFKQFEVTIVKRPEGEYLAQLQSYIARYKTQDGTAIDQQVQQRRGGNLIEKCLGYLIEFVYEEIEKKRRRAIQTMAEVVRNCHTDETIREALLSYLERSPFTEPLEQLARQIESQEWWDILDINNELNQPLLSEVDGARQLLGGCRRTLESFPSHPGLYLLSGFARLLLPNQEVEQALSDIRSGFQNLTDRPISRREEITLEFLRNFEQWSESIQNFEMIQADIAEIALNTLQTRVIAHAIYHMNPLYAERILLNWILQDIENFNQQFLGGAQNAR